MIPAAPCACWYSYASCSIDANVTAFSLHLTFRIGFMPVHSTSWYVRTHVCLVHLTPNQAGLEDWVQYSIHLSHMSTHFTNKFAVMHGLLVALNDVDTGVA